MDISREQILSLFHPILSRIDIGIIFADADGAILSYNEFALQLLTLDAADIPLGLNDVGGIDLMKRIEESGVTQGTVHADGPVCQNAVQFELRLGSELEEPRYIQVRSGIVELPCENGFIRIVMMSDVTRGKQLAAVAAERNQATLRTVDPQMQDLLGRIDMIAPTQASVLLQGESGTGKTELARMIHEKSERAEKPFVEVNCASIPTSLIESELFGHVKGAFTGAAKGRLGRFRAANGGTLFLDEINEFPLELQPKLLRVLQSGQFEAVGSDRTLTVDVRLITASNQELRPLVDHNLFRSDLFYRIAVIPLQVPPLRERPRDIEMLSQHFLQRYASESGRSVPKLGAQTLRVMLGYEWPGNVRELGNAMEHGMICARDGEIEPQDLPYVIAHPVKRPSEGKGFNRDQDEMRAAIEEALLHAGGNRTLAARTLGIDRSTLWRRMQRLGLS